MDGAPRIAVVLGAGGITSVAWQFGALEAVRRETGWDPGEADVLCGTSAGAIAAVVTSAGAPVEPLLEMAEDPRALDASVERATAGARIRHALPLALPGAPLAGLAALRGRLGALAGLLPAGCRSGDEVRGLIHAAAAGGWPRDGRRLLINAVDYATGDRVTFGADGAPAAPLAEAVTASAAVPGLYRPVTIGGRRYVDGGMASFASADVVAPYAPDLVLCLSPFATSSSGGRRDAALLGPLRRATAWQLRRELHGLRRAGARVIVLEPTADDLRVMGVNIMQRRHARAVLEQATASAAAQVERLRLAELVAAPAAALAA